MAGFGMAGQDAAYFNMAVLLILDHQITQSVHVLDVIPYMVSNGTLTHEEAGHITTGATKRIQTDRLVARLKARGVQGYLQLRAALAACGHKYAKLISVIDTNIPPQYNNAAPQNNTYYGY